MTETSSVPPGPVPAGSVPPGSVPGSSVPAAVDPQLLEILVCPVTKQPLRYDREKGELISDAAGLAYPVRDGIPIMLPDQARKLD